MEALRVRDVVVSLFLQNRISEPMKRDATQSDTIMGSVSFILQFEEPDEEP